MNDAWEPFRLAFITAGGSAQGWSIEQKRRIIAAINVCEGVPTKELERIAHEKFMARVAGEPTKKGSN